MNNNNTNFGKWSWYENNHTRNNSRNFYRNNRNNNVQNNYEDSSGGRSNWNRNNYYCDDLTTEHPPSSSSSKSGARNNFWSSNNNSNNNNNNNGSFDSNRRQQPYSWRTQNDYHSKNRDQSHKKHRSEMNNEKSATTYEKHKQTPTSSSSSQSSASSSTTTKSIDRKNKEKKSTSNEQQVINKKIDSKTETDATAKKKSPAAIEIDTSNQKASTSEQSASIIAPEYNAEQVTKKLFNQLTNMDKHNLKQIITNPNTKYDTVLQASARKKLREEMRKQLRNMNLDNSDNAMLDPADVMDSDKIPEALYEEIERVLDCNLLGTTTTTSNNENSLNLSKTDLFLCAEKVLMENSFLLDDHRMSDSFIVAESSVTDNDDLLNENDAAPADDVDDLQYDQKFIEQIDHPRSIDDDDENFIEILPASGSIHSSTIGMNNGMQSMLSVRTTEDINRSFAERFDKINVQLNKDSSEGEMNQPEQQPQQQQQQQLQNEPENTQKDEMIANYIESLCDAQLLLSGSIKTEITQSPLIIASTMSPCLTPAPATASILKETEQNTTTTTTTNEKKPEKPKLSTNTKILNLPNYQKCTNQDILSEEIIRNPSKYCIKKPKLKVSPIIETIIKSKSSENESINVSNATVESNAAIIDETTTITASAAATRNNICPTTTTTTSAVDDLTPPPLQISNNEPPKKYDLLTKIQNFNAIKASAEEKRLASKKKHKKHKRRKHHSNENEYDDPNQEGSSQRERKDSKSPEIIDSHMDDDSSTIPSVCESMQLDEAFVDNSRDESTELSMVVVPDETETPAILMESPKSMDIIMESKSTNDTIDMPPDSDVLHHQPTAESEINPEFDSIVSNQSIADDIPENETEIQLDQTKSNDLENVELEKANDPVQIPDEAIESNSENVNEQNEIIPLVNTTTNASNLNEETSKEDSPPLQTEADENPHHEIAATQLNESIESTQTIPIDQSESETIECSKQIKIENVSAEKLNNTESKSSAKTSNVAAIEKAETTMTTTTTTTTTATKSDTIKPLPSKGKDKQTKEIKISSKSQKSQSDRNDVKSQHRSRAKTDKKSNERRTNMDSKRIRDKSPETDESHGLKMPRLWRSPGEKKCIEPISSRHSNQSTTTTTTSKKSEKPDLMPVKKTEKLDRSSEQPSSTRNRTKNADRLNDRKDRHHGRDAISSNRNTKSSSADVSTTTTTTSSSDRSATNQIPITITKLIRMKEIDIQIYKLHENRVIIDKKIQKLQNDRIVLEQQNMQLQNERSHLLSNLLGDTNIDHTKTIVGLDLHHDHVKQQQQQTNEQIIPQVQLDDEKSSKNNEFDQSTIHRIKKDSSECPKVVEQSNGNMNSSNSSKHMSSATILTKTEQKLQNSSHKRILGIVNNSNLSDTIKKHIENVKKSHSTNVNGGEQNKRDKSTEPNAAVAVSTVGGENEQAESSSDHHGSQSMMKKTNRSGTGKRKLSGDVIESKKRKSNQSIDTTDYLTDHSTASSAQTNSSKSNKIKSTKSTSKKSLKLKETKCGGVDTNPMELQPADSSRLTAPTESLDELTKRLTKKCFVLIKRIDIDAHRKNDFYGFDIVATKTTTMVSATPPNDDNNVTIEMSTNHTNVADDNIHPIQMEIGEKQNQSIDVTQFNGQFLGHQLPIVQIKILDNYMLAASEDGSIYKYNIKTGKLCNQFMHGTKSISGFVVHTNASLYSISLDGTMKKFSLDDNPTSSSSSSLASIDVRESLRLIEHYPNWDCLYIGTKNGKIYVYDTKSDQLNTTPLCTIKKSLVAFLLAEDQSKRILIVATRTTNISIRNAETGAVLRLIEIQPKIRITAIHMNQNNNNSRLYCGTNQNVILTFDFKTGQQIEQRHVGDGDGDKGENSSSAAIKCIKTMRNDLIWCCCDNGILYVYNYRRKENSMEITGTTGQTLLAFDVDKNYIYASSKDNKLLERIEMPETFKTTTTTIDENIESSFSMEQTDELKS